MVTDKKTRTVGSIIEMFERMTPAESLRMKEKTGLVIPEIFAETYQSPGKRGRLCPSSLGKARPGAALTRLVAPISSSARCRPASTGPASTEATACSRSTTAKSDSYWLGSATRISPPPPSAPTTKASRCRPPSCLGTGQGKPGTGL